MAATVTNFNVNEKIPAGQQHFQCYGLLLWSAGGDVYSLANGVTGIANQIRRVFGVGVVDAIVFFGASSDGTGATPVTTGACYALYDAPSEVVRLFVSGRTSGAPGVPQDSRVELANNTSLNNLIFQFVAYCRRSGVSSPSRQ